MPLHVSSTCDHHQEVKIALHSLWYHHTYRCDDTIGCVMQFWTPDDDHMCSKHVEAWNKLIVKQKCCTSSWLITEISILRYTVSKTSKNIKLLSLLCYWFATKPYTDVNSNGMDCRYVIVNLVHMYDVQAWLLRFGWNVDCAFACNRCTNMSKIF